MDFLQIKLFFTKKETPPKEYNEILIKNLCFGDPCPEADILAGIDAAIEDGVDVISISLGLDEPTPFFNDSTAIASFAAMQKGIFVSCAAGNSGPFNGTLSNEAPWILTVGASTHDRKIKAVAKLGNGAEFDGESLFQPKGFGSTLMPLIYPSSTDNPDAALCGEGALNGTDVKGKMVVCKRGGGIGRVAKGEEVKRAGGAAMILLNTEDDGFTTAADAHALPAAHVSFVDGEKILAYINSTTVPIATILFKGTVIGDPTAPAVSSFSSRGPSVQSPGILKPDIIGPGMNILAAWPFPLDGNTDNKATFNIISGTSMACPHLSGVAALLKSSHPYWSPAMMKSAIMTTADLVNVKGAPIVDQTRLPADAFATGAGHVNPSKANDPGLVYDIKPDDYIPYLCGLGYSDAQVGIIAHRPIKCVGVLKIPEGELNYPTFAVMLGPSQTFTRTVTNVGSPYSWYSVVVAAPKGVDVVVSPKKLYFSKTQDLIWKKLRRRIGSGAQTLVYSDPWLTDNHNPYIATEPAPELQNIIVASLKAPNSVQWDSDLLTDLFSSADKERILKIPLGESISEDKWFWAGEKGGLYTVKSGYKAIQQIPNQPQSNIAIKGGEIWNIPVPLKIRNFLWHIFSDCIPTMAALAVKRVDVDLHCPVCQTDMEDASHAFILCPAAKRVWASSSVGDRLFGFSSLIQWLSDLQSSSSTEDFFIVAMILWALWKRRNDVVWNTKNWSDFSVVRRALDSLSQWLAVRFKKEAVVENTEVVLPFNS
ncbi:hypothetical protein LguiA_034228 [Lonicera macranthoides]